MMDLFDLTGKNAVVIGGAGGIGRAIVEGFLEAGANVAIASRKEESLKAAQAEVKAKTGKDIRYYTVDAVNEESVQKLVENTVKDMGKVDILVCSQGMNKKIAVVDLPADTFRQMLDVNITGVLILCKYFGQHMMANHSGKIIVVSSVRGKIASRNVGNVGYCTSKAGVDMLVAQVASEFGAENVCVNGIAPTITETPMMTELIEKRGGDQYRQNLAKSLMLHKMATPEDCVGSAIFLASKASDFMTGHILYPDGGLTALG